MQKGKSKKAVAVKKAAPVKKRVKRTISGTIAKVSGHYKDMLTALLGKKMVAFDSEINKRKKAELGKEISVLRKKIKSV